MEAFALIPTLEFAAAFAVTVVAATLQSTIGFGFALVCVPLLSLLNPSFAPVPQLVVFLPLTLGIAVREWRAVEIRSTAWIFAGRLPGAAIGVLLLKLLSERALDAVMAVMVFVGVAIVVGHRGFRRTPLSEFAAGTASGTMAMVSAIGGPPLALLYRNDTGPTVRANLGMIFSVGLCITLSVRAAAGEVSLDEVVIGLALIPAVLIGLRLSRAMLPHADGKVIANAVVLIATSSALMLLVRSFLSW